MFLYSLTLQPATGVHRAVNGNFSAPKAHEIIISRGKRLELYRRDETTSTLQLIYSQEVFGIIRAICTFRLTGSKKDLLVVGSDSGKIVFLDYSPVLNRFERVHAEAFGKSGCRRVIAGQYVASDPRGRAVMVASIEKQKFVYILNRDSANRLTISSPLEAHKNRIITFDVCGLDVGYANPMFACLEVDYGEKENPESPVYTGTAEKTLTYYEMDLGLNHVVRKAATPVPVSANLLIPVPGGADGPGGVLVCCENLILYRSFGPAEFICPMPRRSDMSQDRGLLINCFSTLKQKDLILIIVQSELGDLYRVILHFDKTGLLNLKMHYFDTIFPCVSICLMRGGFLFAGAECGDQCDLHSALYQILDLGDSEPIFTEPSQPDPTLFMPRSLKNTSLIQEMKSLSPVTAMHVGDLTNEGTPQIYALCGRDSRSSLRVLRHGLGVTEMASSQLPGRPTSLWTVKGKVVEGEPKLDRYIIISFINATLVLSIGDRVTDAKNTGFDTDKQTIHAGTLATGSYLQVLQSGVRHILDERNVSTWTAPSTISLAASNDRQLVISMQGGIVVYFELDAAGKLREVEKREMEQEVMCMTIAAVPEGRSRSRFLAVGCFDSTVRVLSLDPEGCLGRLSTQALPSSQPKSVSLVEMGFGTEGVDLYLHVGLTNGVMLRTVVDSVNGQLSDTRARFLGSKPVRLYQIQMANTPAVAALSSRPWLCYTYLRKTYVTPLAYEQLDYLHGFSSQQCPEGLIAVAGSSLRIFMIDKLGELFQQTVVPLRYTPRKICVNSNTQDLVIVETDHNSFPHDDRQMLKQAVGFQDSADLTEDKIGVPKAGAGRWASCIRVFNPTKMETTALLEQTENECVVSCCLGTFEGFLSEMLLVVGTVRDLVLHPQTFSAAFINVLRVNGNELTLLHKTPVEAVPMALCVFYGKLLAGIGKTLRLYEVGAKKLLRKSENKVTFPLSIHHIKVHEERIFACDVSESFSVLRYNREDKQIYAVADDVIPRWTTACCVLDHDTIAAVDKFENVVISRVPPSCYDDAEQDASSIRYKWEVGYLGGAYFKLDQVAHFYIGELATSIQKTELTDGGASVLLYGTTMGSLGALMPIARKEDVEFFVHLELYMRLEAPPLCGREHLAFRSSYAPVANTVDGDLCELFSTLDPDRQHAISEELKKTPTEVLKKLEDFRNRIL